MAMNQAVMTGDSSRQFSASFMSNSKWHKLFSVINRDILELHVCVWKLISETEPIEGLVPDYNLLGDNYLGDCGALSTPVEFKRIEWLWLPARHGYTMYDKGPKQYVFQDLSLIFDNLKSVGQFETERVNNGLKIYGYKH